MDRVAIMLRLLREIHEIHLRTVGGYRVNLILANDQALLALLNGDEDAVRQYADRAWPAYCIMEVPQARDRLVKLSNMRYHQVSAV